MQRCIASDKHQGARPSRLGRSQCRAIGATRGAGRGQRTASRSASSRRDFSRLCRGNARITARYRSWVGSTPRPICASPPGHRLKIAGSARRVRQLLVELAEKPKRGSTSLALAPIWAGDDLVVPTPDIGCSQAEHFRQHKISMLFSAFGLAARWRGGALALTRPAQ